MSVKDIFIKLLLAVATICASSCWAQTYPTNWSYHHRLHEGYKGWERIIPTHTKLQYAGGMGVISAGIGWDYGQLKRWETDIFIGYLPGRYADKTHLTLTLRQNYIPWLISLDRRLDFEPFACGLYLNFISGERFWTQQPSRYPGQRYYNFTSRLRTHIYIGQRITLNMLSQNSTLRGITLYYELSANDLNIVSKFGNKSQNISDIVYFSAGVKFQVLSRK